MSTAVLPQRIADKIDFSGECWLWQGRVSTTGYGQVWFEGRPRQVHRVVHTLLVGPIPDGMQIDHTCSVRTCVRHTEVVTSQENHKRRGDRVTECPQGHAYTPENTYIESRGYKSCRTCRNGR